MRLNFDIPNNNVYEDGIFSMPFAHKRWHRSELNNIATIGLVFVYTFILGLCIVRGKNYFG